MNFRLTLKRRCSKSIAIKQRIIVTAAAFVLITLGRSITVCAEEPFIPRSVPHLIQTVSEKDIYEGMLALGFLEAPVLETEDCEAAYENVKGCIVQIHMKDAYGSGVVWEMTSTQIIIVTNKHVLAYWSDETDYVHFPQGYSAKARLMGTSAEYDIGFLCVDCLEFDYQELEQLRYVHDDMEVYQSLQTGDAIFCIGADAVVSTESTANFYQGSIGDTWRYIEEFDEYMLYGYGYAREGMSGGGTFDAKGNFIGMLAGATMEGETASVPLPLIVEAYGKMREMQDTREMQETQGT